MFHYLCMSLSLCCTPCSVLRLLVVSWASWDFCLTTPWYVSGGYSIRYGHVARLVQYSGCFFKTSATHMLDLSSSSQSPRWDFAPHAYQERLTTDHGRCGTHPCRGAAASSSVWGTGVNLGTHGLLGRKDLGWRRGTSMPGWGRASSDHGRHGLASHRATRASFGQGR
jgi:hypothetical protein